MRPSAAGPIARPSERAPRRPAVAVEPRDQAAERARLVGSAAASSSATGSSRHARRGIGRIAAAGGRGRDSSARPGRRGSGWPDHPLVGAGQLDPLGPERALVLVQAVHRLALARLAARAGDVDAAEVHLGAPLADRELDRAPAEQVGRARDGRRGSALVAGVDGREALAVAVQEQAGQRIAPRVVAGLEVDEVAGRDAPPSTSRRTTRAART